MWIMGVLFLFFGADTNSAAFIVLGFGLLVFGLLNDSTTNRRGHY